jgi:glycosyltransferase involved in cell wall biosynthesis
LSNRLPFVFLLTHERTRANLAEIQGVNQDHLMFIPDTWAHKFLHAISSRLPERIATITSGALLHLVTQFYQWKMARKIIREHGIDIVHEPAPVSPRQPSMMFALGVPVIIGPMNGGMTFPPAFAKKASRFERLTYSSMRILTSLFNILIPGKMLASVLLVANRRTMDALPSIRFGKVIELVENGVFLSKVRLSERMVLSETHPLKLLYVGRLVDLKSVDIAIDAIGMCRNRNVKLIIVGDGLDRQRLEAYASKVAFGKVTFLGAVPHSKILDCYDNADIFVLPSVRECGGAVILEAMARGLPIVATNWGGPSDYVTSETGFLVNPISREFMVTEFARNIDTLAANSELRLKFGQAAIKYVSEKFLWENKADTVIQLYESILKA